MAVAVFVKYMNATNSRSSRLKVYRADHDGSKGDIALTYTHNQLNNKGLCGEDAALEAFRSWSEACFALAEKNGNPDACHWLTGAWAAGFTKEGYVMVKVSQNTPDGSRFAIL